MEHRISSIEAFAEGRRIAETLLLLGQGDRVDAFARAYAAFMATSGTQLQERPVPGLERFLMFPALTWREARLLDSTLARTMLLRVSNGVVWAVQMPAVFAVTEELLALLAEKLQRASSDISKLEYLSARLSRDLVRLRVVNLPLNDLDAPEWEVEKASRAICYAVVGKAIRWYSARNLGPLRECFLGLVRGGLQRALKHFVEGAACLESKALGKFGPLTVNRFNYLTNCSSEIARNRAQAAALYPLFFPALAGEQKKVSPTVLNPLHAIVDQGRPFVKEVSALLGVKREVIRQLHFLNPETIGERWLEEPDLLVRMLGALPREKRPSSRPEWVRFNQTVWVFQTMTGDIRSYGLLAYWLRDAAAAGFGADPSGVLAHLRQSSAARGVADFLGAVREGLIVATEQEGGRGLTRRPEFSAIANDLLLRTLHRISVKRLVEYAVRWHDHYRALQEETALPQDRRQIHQWDALSPALQVGDLTVVGLLSESALADEGRALRHCVGTYFHRCWAYRSFVFSVRDRAGRSLSTFELALRGPGVRPDADGRRLVRLVQHAGPENSEPPPCCARAAGTFMQHVETTVPVAWIKALLEKSRLRAEILKTPRQSARHAWVLVESLQRTFGTRSWFQMLVQELVNVLGRDGRSEAEGP